MVIITTREFRQKQKMYLDLVDKNVQVIVQRGKGKAYALTPINDDDVYFNKFVKDSTNSKSLKFLLKNIPFYYCK